MISFWDPKRFEESLDYYKKPRWKRVLMWVVLPITLFALLFLYWLDWVLEEKDKE